MCFCGEPPPSSAGVARAPACPAPGAPAAASLRAGVGGPGVSTYRAGSRARRPRPMPLHPYYPSLLPLVRGAHLEQSSRGAVVPQTSGGAL